MLEARGFEPQIFDKEYYRIAEEDGGISLDQLKKLDLVWCGERRLSEMVAIMEK